MLKKILFALGGAIIVMTAVFWASMAVHLLLKAH